MNEKEHSRRYKFLNPGLLDEIQSQGKNILLLMCHYGNWEWLSILPRYTRMPNLAIYKPLQNKKFDKLFLELRGKYGVIGVSMETTLRHMARYEEKKQPVILFSLADQRPQKKKTRYWARFMNQDSAILAGTEKLCRRFNMAVVFLQVTRLQRGYYHIKFVPVSLDPEKNEEFEITRKYFDLVESLIRKKPEYWLWSHNRWKYSRWPSKDHVDIDQVLSRH